MATVENRHLLIGNVNADRYTLIIDWQQPANRIENWTVTGGSAFPPGMSYDQFVSMVVAQYTAQSPGGVLPNLSLEAAGFDAPLFNEMLGYYAQREASLAAGS